MQLISDILEKQLPSSTLTRIGLCWEINLTQLYGHNDKV